MATTKNFESDQLQRPEVIQTEQFFSVRQKRLLCGTGTARGFPFASLYCHRPGGPSKLKIFTRLGNQVAPYVLHEHAARNMPPHRSASYKLQ